jgi:hypothetical protein
MEDSRWSQNRSEFTDMSDDPGRVNQAGYLKPAG